MKKQFLSTILFIGLVFSSFSQQSTLKEGWKAFEESNYKLAISKFEAQSKIKSWRWKSESDI
mgnify:CR=1 FL=1